MTIVIDRPPTAHEIDHEEVLPYLVLLVIVHNSIINQGSTWTVRMQSYDLSNATFDELW